MDRRELCKLHKMKPTRFNTAQLRQNVINQFKSGRQDRRTENFNHRRNISLEDEVEENDRQVVNDKVASRRLALLKFKAEKDAKKQEINAKKKPPFVVGIPHHGSSPVLREMTNENQRVTRAAKRAFPGNVMVEKVRVPKHQTETNAKAPVAVRAFPFNERKSVFTFRPTRSQTLKRLTSPQTPTVLKRSAKKNPNPSMLKQVKSEVQLKTVKPLTASTDGAEPLAESLPQRIDVDAANDEGLRKEPLGLLNVGIRRNRRTSVRSRTDGGTTSSPRPLSSPEPGTSSSSPKPLTSPEPGTSSSSPRPLSSPEPGTSSSSPKPLTSPEPGTASSSPKPLTSPEPGTSSSSPRPLSSPEPGTSSSSPKPLTSREPGTASSSPKPLTSPEPVTSDFASLQRSRLDEETIRLGSLADRWEALALQENPPVDVVDEIDSLVGQTRLLTRDKFQQFRRLIIQFETGEGDHPVTSEDLNGFWDMIYLQVEGLQKRYTTLQNRKDLDWQEQVEVLVKKRPVTKKSRPGAAASSALRETMKAKRAKLRATVSPGNENIKTPTNTRNSFIAQVLSHGNRSRKNSPAAYVAMRLSGAGRPSAANETMDPMTSSLSRSILKPRIKSEVCQSARKTVLFDSSPNENNEAQGDAHETPDLFTKKEEIVEGSPATADQDENILNDESLEVTRRRSLRLLGRTQTPIMSKICHSCISPDNSVSKERPNTPRRSRRNIFPSIKLEVVDADVEAKETNPAKGSSGKTFVLRPSKLTEVTNNLGAIPKKRRRKVREAQISPAEDNDEATHTETRSSVRKSSRLRASRTVTFNSSTEDKSCLKLPATPFQRSGGKKVAESPQTPC